MRSAVPVWSNCSVVAVRSGRSAPPSDGPDVGAQTEGVPTASSTSRRLRWALVLVGGGVVVLVGFTGYQALKAKSALEEVAADFEKLSGQLASGDESGAEATLADAQRHAGDARSNTRGPGWWLSARIPQLGPNVKAVASVAEVADTLASDVLPDVLDASRTLSPRRLRRVNGRIALAPSRPTAPSIERAATRLTQQARLVHAIDTESLAPQIAAPVQDLDAKIGNA